MNTCKIAIMVSLLISLSGCVSNQTQLTKFYILNALDRTATPVIEESQAQEISIDIASLLLPQYLERSQIVTRNSNNRLNLAEYNQWGSNLRKNMSRVLARNLSHLLSTPNISTALSRPISAPDFRIDLEIMQFEHGPDKHIHLTTQWRVSSGATRKTLISQITTLKSAEKINENDYDMIVATMSKVYNNLSTAIAKAIQDL